MNNYIYRASSKPEEVYLLLEGMVKLEKPGFSQQTLKENILLNSGMIFGDKDIKLEERSRNAVTCTAHVEVLTIPKT
jgi:CRP-like cAMP-binding protein